MTTNTRSKRAWGVLAAALALEFVAGAVVIVGMIPTFPASGPNSQAEIPLWLSLFICLVVWWVWIGATLLGALRTRRSRVRSSSFTIHVLIFAAGMGVLQGFLGTPPIGYALAGVAIVGFFATLLTKPTPSPDELPPSPQA